MIRRKRLPSDALARLADLGDALARCPAVAFAYLFGGAARGELGPLSDIDVAVYLCGPDPLEARLEVIGAATRHLGTDEIDIVVLNSAPSALVGRILQSRRVIVDREPFLRHRFESEELRKFFDFRELERHALEGRRPGG